MQIPLRRGAVGMAHDRPSKIKVMARPFVDLATEGLAQGVGPVVAVAVQPRASQHGMDYLVGSPSRQSFAPKSTREKWCVLRLILGFESVLEQSLETPFRTLVERNNS